MKFRKLLMCLLLLFFWMQIVDRNTTQAAWLSNGEENTKKVSEESTDKRDSEKNGESAAKEAIAKDGSTTNVESQVQLLNDKVRRLEELVEKQQRVIEALQPKQASYESNSVTESSSTNLNGSATGMANGATNGTAPAINLKTAETQAAGDEQAKKIDALYKSFGQINISGDLRFRYDGQFSQGFDAPMESPDRNRLRIRARVQLAGQFHKNFDYAVRLSTGGFTNPTTANATNTDFFNRKAFALDRYFIRYDSKTEPAGVILQAGKFDYPWKRTELTFDNDLQPEGTAETFYVKGKGVFKDFRVIAYQLPFNEVSAGKDSVLYGGQVQGTVANSSWRFVGAATFNSFNQVDALARSLGRPNTQVGGGLETGTTNRVRRDANGNIIGFVANFNVLDVLGELTYLKIKKYPITLLFNYARNMSERLDKLGERNGYWTEFKVGQLKEKGDMEFTYTFSRVEQDAVLSPFSFDDFLVTNSRNSRVTFGYTLNSNLFLQSTLLFSERFNVLPNVENRTQKRVQLDVNYRF